MIGSAIELELPHVLIRQSLMQTAAWRSLDPVARAVYIDIAAKYDGSNNGKIAYAVRQGGEALNASKNTVALALERLQERGFISPVVKGAFSRKSHHATEWRLTEFPCDVTKAIASKEFMRWPGGAE